MIADHELTREEAQALERIAIATETNAEPLPEASEVRAWMLRCAGLMRDVLDRQPDREDF